MASKEAEKYARAIIDFNEPDGITADLAREIDGCASEEDAVQTLAGWFDQVICSGSESEGVEKFKAQQVEREMLIHWLLIAHDTLGREGWEAGRSDKEVRSGLLHVLGNLNYSPHSKEGKELLKRKPVYYVDEKPAARKPGR